MSENARPLAAVPVWVGLLLVGALAAQLAVHVAFAPRRAAATDLPPAPSAAAVKAASFGEPQAAARLAMLWLQAFDSSAANQAPYRNLDYGRLIGWLAAILHTDPRSRYPLFAAARIYAEVPDPAKARAMMEFIHAEYLKAPRERWPALAHAALLAKHRLEDLPLALRYAQALRAVADEPNVPLWAKQMEIFILEDMNELEAAKIMLGGLLATGRITDPGEHRFLQSRLEALERRLATGKARQGGR
ncbi:MAG: hypothetical protein AB1773_00150 [Pseudomonadota bacterium]